MSPQLLIIFIFAAFALLEAFKTGFLKKPGQTWDDGFVEIIGPIVLLALTQPFIFFLADRLMTFTAPTLKDSLVNWPLWAHLALLLILDDMMQYWWHRASHTFPFLYGLHRAHHNAEYLSVRVVYRNNVFYYLMMPSIWLSGILIYLGLGWTYAIYLVVKMTVIIGAHSEWRWAQKLYTIKWLAPLMWILERTISTPATHAAHHGKYKADGITHYKGNFGNLLFFWDILFGTAKITRTYPKEFGVENLKPMNWYEQLFWPVFAGTRPAEEVTDTTTDSPQTNP